MNNDLRNRLRKSKVPEKSVDAKLADFFSEDEKLKKYSKKGLIQDENDLAIALRKLQKKTKVQTKKAAKKIRDIDVSKLKSKIKSIPVRRTALVSVLLVAVIIGVSFIRAQEPQEDTPAVQGTTTEAEIVEPEFSVATISSDLQPTDVAYDAERKVASFGISLDADTDVIVSQQEITPADASRENFLLNVAQSFDINREVQTTKGPLFLGTNQKQRVVTAVFQEGTFLFFIRSNNLIEDERVIKIVEEIQF